MTDVRDMARALVAVAAEPSAWGRVWHAPTNPAKTQAETVADVCRSVGRDPAGQVLAAARCSRSAGFGARCCASCGRPSTSSAAPYVLDSSAIEGRSASRRRRGTRSAGPALGDEVE